MTDKKLAPRTCRREDIIQEPPESEAEVVSRINSMIALWAQRGMESELTQHMMARIERISASKWQLFLELFKRGTR